MESLELDRQGIVEEQRKPLLLQGTAQPGKGQGQGEQRHTPAGSAFLSISPGLQSTPRNRCKLGPNAPKDTVGN